MSSSPAAPRTSAASPSRRPPRPRPRRHWRGTERASPRRHRCRHQHGPDAGQGRVGRHRQGRATSPGTSPATRSTRQARAGRPAMMGSRPTGASRGRKWGGDAASWAKRDRDARPRSWRLWRLRSRRARGRGTWTPLTRGGDLRLRRAPRVRPGPGPRVRLRDVRPGRDLDAARPRRGRGGRRLRASAKIVNAAKFFTVDVDLEDEEPDFFASLEYRADDTPSMITAIYAVKTDDTWVEWAPGSHNWSGGARAVRCGPD